MMKHTIDDLALFGGRPLFDRPRPIGQLDMPDLETYLAAVRTAYDARHLTNDGDLARLLEERLADRHGVRHCVALANAGLGLMMLMQIFAAGRKGTVVMPAFSYRGLPHFARWAGLEPAYCDCDRMTHTLDPQSVEALLDERTTSILAVCNANSPGDITGLCAVAAQHKLPIFFDSVYALGSTYMGQSLGGFGNAEVYSLHATKLLNGFEGGYVTTNDDQLAKILRWQRNFSLPAFRPDTDVPLDHVVGLNAKLNELHAAMALCCLDRLDNVIAGNRARYDAYRDACAPISGLEILPYAGHDRRNYEIVIAEVMDRWPLARDRLLAVLRAEGCAIAPYYSPPLYRSAPAEGSPPSFTLPNTEWLAGRFLQLPVGELVGLQDIARIGTLLAFIADNGAAIASRLDRESGSPP